MKTGINEIKYSISIVSHNQFDLCRRVIKSFIENVPNIEIIITFNIPEEFNFSSKSNTPIKIIQNKNPKGFGANHNQAFLSSIGSYFMIVNPDILILEWSETKLDLNTIYTPTLFELDGSKCDNIRSYPSPINLLRRILFKKKESKIDWFAGMFLIVHKNLFEKLCGFDDRFFMYLEDSDLCLRAKKNGAELKVLKEITAIHDARRSSRSSIRFLLMHLKSLCKFYLKHPKLLLEIS